MCIDADIVQKLMMPKGKLETVFLAKYDSSSNLSQAAQALDVQVEELFAA